VLIAQGAIIDIPKVGDPFCLTPAAKLAYEDDKDSSEFLREHFFADATKIAAAAALASNKSYAEILREYYDADIHCIAEAAARVGNEEYAEELRGKGASFVMIAFGAARGGFSDYVEKLKEENPGWEDPNTLSYYAALGEQETYVNQLLNNGADEMMVSCGYARAGRSDLIAQLQYVDSIDVNILALAAAAGGQFEYVETLLSQGADVNIVAKGAAEGGYLSYVEKLRRENDINVYMIAHGAAKGGYYSYLEKLWEEASDRLEFINDVVKFVLCTELITKMSQLIACLSSCRLELFRAGFLEGCINSAEESHYSSSCSFFSSGLNSNDILERVDGAYNPVR
jgi:hypothetical protein